MIEDANELRTLFNNMSLHFRWLQHQTEHAWRVNANMRRDWSRTLRMHDERKRRVAELAIENDELREELYNEQISKFEINRTHRATWAALRHKQDVVDDQQHRIDGLIDDHAIVLAAKQHTIQSLQTDLAELRSQLNHERAQRAIRDEHRREAAEARRPTNNEPTDSEIYADNESSSDSPSEPDANHNDGPVEPETDASTDIQSDRGNRDRLLYPRGFSRGNANAGPSLRMARPVYDEDEHGSVVERNAGRTKGET